MIHVPEPVRFTSLRQLPGLDEGDWFAQYEPPTRGVWLGSSRHLVWNGATPAETTHFNGLVMPMVDGLRCSVEVGVAKVRGGWQVRLLDADVPGHFQERMERVMDEAARTRVTLESHYRFIHGLEDLNLAFSRVRSNGCKSIVLKRWTARYPGMSTQAPTLWMCAIRITRPVRAQKRRLS